MTRNVTKIVTKNSRCPEISNRATSRPFSTKSRTFYARIETTNIAHLFLANSCRTRRGFASYLCRRGPSLLFDRILSPCPCRVGPSLDHALLVLDRDRRVHGLSHLGHDSRLVVASRGRAIGRDPLQASRALLPSWISAGDPDSRFAALLVTDSDSCNSSAEATRCDTCRRCCDSTRSQSTPSDFLLDCIHCLHHNGCSHQAYFVVAENSVGQLVGVNRRLFQAKISASFSRYPLTYRFSLSYRLLGCSRQNTTSTEYRAKSNR